MCRRFNCVFKYIICICFPICSWISSNPTICCNWFECWFNISNRRRFAVVWNDDDTEVAEFFAEQGGTGRSVLDPVVDDPVPVRWSPRCPRRWVIDPVGRVQVHDIGEITPTAGRQVEELRTWRRRGDRLMAAVPYKRVAGLARHGPRPRRPRGVGVDGAGDPQTADERAGEHRRPAGLSGVPGGERRRLAGAVGRDHQGEHPAARHRGQRPTPSQ